MPPALLHRRQFIGGLAAVAGAALAPGTRAAATRAIIDVHAHYMPPDLKAAGTPAPVMAQWTIQRHLEAMEDAGVARSILSITTPGVTATGPGGWSLIRACNEYGSSLAAQYPRQLGFFVYARLDDFDRALAEIAHGLDDLKACGVGLFTNYDNHWLGDPKFAPIFAELDRRRAVVYVHPTAPPCCRNLIPGLADPVIEYGTDTSRAIASYVYRGAALRYPNVTMIWSHSGGTMPYLIERFDVLDRNPDTKATAPLGFRGAAAKFYYDVAQASNPVATTALRSVVPVDHIVFGTDYPYRTPREHVKQLEAGHVFKSRELADLYHGNVSRHLPQLLARTT